MANDLLSRNSNAALRGDPLIPWVENEDYPLGKPITGIRRTPTDVVEISFGGNADRSGEFPMVVQTVYLLDGEQSTQLVLEDELLRRTNGRT